jgi:PAS domain S-box-containing protein
VTELRRSEAALRRAHEELAQRRALVAAASLDGVWEWEAATERVQYSHRFAELLGYTAADIPQTLDFFRSILHPDDSESLWTAVDRHLKEGIPYDVECRLRTKDGDYRWFRTRGRAQHDAEGCPTWMAGSLQDIHPQKTAENNLREALRDVQQLTDQLRAENTYLQEEITSSQGFDEIVGESDVLRSVLAQVDHVAATDASVLLLGETGTGKELLARAIHNRSSRHERSLVKVNLAALPSSLIESELFGHIKGAFTGAVRDKTGRFQLADGGTLFLDEIGELNLELQTKLLRVLQEGEFERIGSPETLRVDVRIVAATNRDLRHAMEQNMFRPDLYYRLAVFPIEVPPLRLRRDDIPLLTWHFVGKKQTRLGKPIKNIPTKVMQALIEYDWPGNIRELENVIERAMILSPGTTLSLPEPLKQLPHAPRPVASANRTEIDRNRILKALEASRWKVKGAGNAAERLGLNPSTLRYRMKVLGIQRP